MRMSTISKTTRRRLLQGVPALCLCAVAGFRGTAPVLASEIEYGPFSTLEELAASLTSAGVSASDQRTLLGMALPALALQTEAAGDAAIPIGASKIGGAPDLPAGTAWPMRAATAAGDGELAALRDIISEMAAKTFAGGEWTAQQYQDGIKSAQAELDAKTKLYMAPAPLTFLMQVDLESLRSFPVLASDLPRDGRLLVFYDMIARPWFARDADKRPLFHVMHDTSPASSLERREAPELGYPLVSFSKGDERDTPFLKNHMPPARIAPVFTYTLPDTFSQPMFSRAAAQGQDVPQQGWNEQRPSHLGASNRLSGWPELIQNDMRFELAARDNAIELPTGSVAAYSAGIESLTAEAAKWTLLLQIGDYDNDVWDLNGLYYIWIKRSDLAERAFEKAEMIYQTD
jgi:hypothetical protein